jgi:protein-tyrosine phosphatase
MIRVLFICTGNFYRSRFAEAVFNYHAEREGKPWRAFSRGLAIHFAEGYLSPFTAEALAKRNIDLRHTAPHRTQITEHDLSEATLAIALDRTEHLPMMREQFPAWADRIQYWEVADLPFSAPETALPAIETKVNGLLTALGDHQRVGFEEHSS